jgi:3-phenylpropionate/trans-cinnamate dioxygenase ferredoxin subunit
MPITITVRQNGPLFISADDAPQITILDHAGNRIEPKPGKGIALCRCGASVNKPFCDGTHSRIGFQGARAAQEAFDAQGAGTPAAAPPAPAGPVAVPAASVAATEPQQP